MKRILIFGSNGLLGQSLVRTMPGKAELFGASLEKESVSDLETGHYRQVDITVRSMVNDLIDEIQPSVLINAAAFTNVDKCETDREICWAVNVKAVENILDAANRLNGAVYVHLSSDYVFSGDNPPYDEDDAPSPRGNYARSKMAAENIIRSSTMEYIIIRTQILYGPGRNLRPNFVTWLISELRSQKPVQVVSDQTGNPTHVDDVAYGIQQLLEREEYGLYHISGSQSISRYDFALKIADQFGLDRSLVNRVNTAELNQKAPRPANSTFRIDKIVNRAGFLPLNIEQGLQKLKRQLENING